MLFTPSTNSTTGFLLQTMLYVANITKHDLNAPKTREDFLLSPMGADSGKSNDSCDVIRIFNFSLNKIVSQDIVEKYLNFNCVFMLFFCVQSRFVLIELIPEIVNVSKWTTINFYISKVLLIC